MRMLGTKRWSAGAIALAMALAACQGPQAATTPGQEVGFSAQRGGKGKLSVAGKDLALRTRDGRELGEIAVQIGGKAYPLKGGKLVLPADALAKARAEGGLLVVAPGYVPRRVALDQAGEAVLVPIEGEASAVVGAGGGKAGGGAGAVVVSFPAGRLGADAPVVVATYDPPDAAGAVVTAEQDRLGKALQRAGVTPPPCGTPLPCPPPQGAIGVYVAVDGPLEPGVLPVTVDLVALRRGWDGQGTPPWDGAAAGWTETERRQAMAADRILTTFAAIDARPDAATWRQALAAEFGLTLEGRYLGIEVPLDAAARTDGTARIAIVGAALLGALIEVTVVSTTAGELPAAARPSSMPSPDGQPAAPGGATGAGGGTGRGGSPGAGGTGGTGGSGGPGAGSPYRLRGDATMGPDGGSVLFSFGGLVGPDGASLIGPDGASLIGMDGATLIGVDGATLLPRDGVPLIGMDGASLIGMDGATLVGPDGATLVGPDGASLVGPDGASLVGPDGATLIGPDGGSLIGPDGGSLVANNAGGALTGQLRVPFTPETGAKYRLAAYTDHAWPLGRVWALNGLGQPYAEAATADEKGDFAVNGLQSTLSGVVLAASAGPYKLFALAKAPGAATRQVALDAATTAAACVFLADGLKTPEAIRPVDLDRYQALVATLRDRMSDADAQYVVSHPIQAVAKHVLTLTQGAGITAALGPVVTTFAGTPTAGLGAGPFVGGDMRNGQGRFWFPTDLLLDGPDLLVADNNNNAIQRVRLADAFGTTFRTSTQQPRTIVKTPAGKIVFTTGDTAKLFEFDVNGVESRLAGTTSNRAFPNTHLDGPALSARLGQTMGLALSAAGEWYFSDGYDQRICKLAGGVVSTVAGDNDPLVDFADGTLAQARFTRPYALMFEPDGDLLISDYGARRVRVLRPNGTVATIAGNGVFGHRDGLARTATFDRPLGMARDAAGNVYVCDGGAATGSIRKITPAGVVLTIAGGRPMRAGEAMPHADGPGSHAMFHDPHALIFGPAGELYVADSRNHVIRKITF